MFIIVARVSVVAMAIQVYGFILSCMLYRDTNTAVAAMETMNAILNSSSIALTHWLMTSQPSATMATQYWLPVQRLNDDGKEEEEREGVRGETHSLGEVQDIMYNIIIQCDM